MKEYLKKIDVRKALVVLCILALAFLAEWGFVLLSGDGLRYTETAFSADDFSYWEMEERNGGQYYMLAYNSYFYIDNLGGVPVYAVDIYMERPSEDATERVVKYTGTKDGIYGRYTAPLSPTADGLYTAVLEIEALDRLEIFPTERVRTLIGFDGARLNPYVGAARYSLARVILWGFLLSSLYILYKLVLKKVKEEKAAVGWLEVYCWAGTLLMLVLFQATRMFSSSRGLEQVLLPLGIGAFTALYLLVWLMAKKTRSTAARIAVAVAILGTLFAFANAPLQMPDENTHFMRAYAISQGDFTFDAGHVFPDDVHYLSEYFPAEFYHNVQSRGGGNILPRIIGYWRALDTPYSGEAYTTPLQLLFPYFPSAVGIAVARLFGANALICLYAGRLCNVAVFALCAYFALKWAARGRGALIALILLPLTLYVVASNSYDSMLLSCAVLFFGLLFKEDLRRRDLLLILLAFGFIVAVKPIYLTLAPLLFTIPKEQLAALKTRRVALFFVALGVGLLAWGGTMLYAEVFRYGIQPLPKLDGVDVQAQIMYVLKNPLRYLMVLLVDGYMNSFYITSFGLFGWLDVFAPFASLATPILLVVIGALYADQSGRGNNAGNWWVLLSLVLSYVVMVTGFYCSWSPLGGTSILGVQARYLLPVVPCAVLLLSRALSPLLRFRHTAPAQAGLRDAVAVYLCFAVSLLSACEVAVTYFLR